MSRIKNKDINQYFEPFDSSEIQELAKARDESDYDGMADIMANKLTSYGISFSMVFQEAYDDEIWELASQLIKVYLRDIEAESVKAFQETDIKNIRELKDQMDVDFGGGFTTRTNRIKRQLKDAINRLSVPEVIKPEVKKLLISRGKNIEDVRTSKIVERWGRVGRLALLTWGRKGVIAVKYLDKVKPKLKTPKLKFIPTKEEWVGKTKEKILSRKGETFTYREKLFVDSRKKSKPSAIMEDYYNEFGRVRPKSEISKLIKKIV